MSVGLPASIKLYSVFGAFLAAAFDGAVESPDHEENR